MPGEKILEILLSPLSTYTTAKSRKNVISTTFNGYNSKSKEREFQVHICNRWFMPSVSFGTSLGSKFARLQSSRIVRQ